MRTKAGSSQAGVLSGLTAFLQPIMHLPTGRIVGFEALARLRADKSFLLPGQFLPRLPGEHRMDLFVRMLRLASRFIAAARAVRPELYVTVNVESSLLLREGFCETVAANIGVNDVDRPSIYLELLESERIVDFAGAASTLTRLKQMGVGASLDDVGSAYASLMVLKRLPIDIIKLDQAFARDLRGRPEDLQFVSSVVSLARGLDRKLIVEGVETPDILDALATIGAEFGQGYAIARPMPMDEAGGWLAEQTEVRRQPTPSSLLGVYAAHLNIVETCRFLTLQPLPIAWSERIEESHACAIGVYFDRLGIQATPHGLAHKRFHEVIHLFATESDRWHQAAAHFRRELTRAILAENAGGAASATAQPSHRGNALATTEP